ncbi:MAG: apolipoprotein N-acyltransferase [bacterium]|nr:apolipoprotein N-acyltransferase [bacterium]
MRCKLIGAGLLAALLYHLALPPSLGPWLGWICLLPLFAALDGLRPHGRQAGIWLALPFGLLFNILTFRWMMSLNAAADLTVPWIMAPAVLLWSLYLTLYPWLFIRIYLALRPRLGSLGFLLAPLIWTLLEWVRGSGMVAFSWIHLSQSQAASGGYLAPAGWLGGLGLTFLMVGFQVSLSALCWGGRQSRRPALIALALSILICGALSRPSFEPGDETIRVAAVQGNISLQDKWEPHFRMENLRIFSELSHEAVNDDAELLIWPETAFPVNVYWDRHAEAALRRAAISLGTDIVTGFQGLAVAPTAGFLYYNAAGMVGHSGALEGVYYKEHLLPFGERIPLVDLLTPGLHIDLGQSDFTPGPGARVLRGGAVPLSVFICYEMGFAASVRRSAADGSRLLVNITNDGWFEHPLAMELHAALTPMRAVESGLPAVRCGNSGITVVVDAEGAEIGRLPTRIRDKLVCDLQPSASPSFYARYGDRSSPLLLGLYGLLLVFGAFRSSGSSP